MNGNLCRSSTLTLVLIALQLKKLEHDCSVISHLKNFNKLVAKVGSLVDYAKYSEALMKYMLKK